MKWVVIVLLLLVMLVSVWAIILFLAKPVSCPQTLPPSYYTCSTDADCSYHPKYRCINSRPLNCVINEDLSSAQEVGKMFYCRCVDHRCITERLSRH